MIDQLLAAAFPIFRQVEGYPVCDILERRLTNNPFENVLNTNTPYTLIMSEVECVFSRMDARTDLGDNTINTNTSFYFLETTLQGLVIGVRHIIKYKGAYYAPTTGGTTADFGLIEIRVLAGN
jgi:hypothetical protein